MKNRSNRIALALGTVAILGCGVLQAADKPCTRPDVANASRSIDKVMSFSQLHKAWGDYRQCDSGEIGELFTDALLRLVVEWKGVEELASAMAKDPDYKAFVMTHLTSPAAKDDQPTVYSRARKDCPKTLDAFCADVADAVKGTGTPTVSKGGIELEPLMEPIKPAAKADAKNK